MISYTTLYFVRKIFLDIIHVFLINANIACSFLENSSFSIYIV